MLTLSSPRSVIDAVYPFAFVRIGLFPSRFEPPLALRI
ncbi:hypothetical protein NJ7G_0156 [Natrinema sp. J7-2]|nr:hypothetical protein NJ7G_0156 [Natrinema sp. J7-2]